MKGRKLASRISVSLDRDNYQELGRIADMHEVSVSWLTRYAINEFLAQCKQGKRIELVTADTREEKCP